MLPQHKHWLGLAGHPGDSVNQWCPLPRSAHLLSTGTLPLHQHPRISRFPLRFIRAPSSHHESDPWIIVLQILQPQEIPVLFIDKHWDCRPVLMQAVCYITVEAAAALFSPFSLSQPVEPLSSVFPISTWRTCPALPVLWPISPF